MDTLDKLHFIESDAVPKEGATCEPLSTSIQITHCCGCMLTQHFAGGHAQHRDHVLSDDDLQMLREQNQTQGHDINYRVEESPVDPPYRRQRA